MLVFDTRPVSFVVLVVSMGVFVLSARFADVAGVIAGRASVVDGSCFESSGSDFVGCSAGGGSVMSCMCCLSPS